MDSRDNEMYLMAKLPAMDFEAVFPMSVCIMTRQVLFYYVLNRSARCHRSRLSLRAGGTTGSIPAAASMAFQVPILPA